LSFVTSIIDKREGRSLSGQAISDFVRGVSDGSLPDYQISALLMAILLCGMDVKETRALTVAMADSGRRYDWSSLDRPSADKHSTGGVGDKVSLVLAPLAAACGLAVPMLSGRGLGFTGGTLDKLESIPGFETRLSESRAREILIAEGLCLIGQSKDLAPADRKLYALRDVTGTVESLPLIVSSILSKKLAAGPRALVIDLKVGQGAFMTDMIQARELGEALRSTAGALDLPCSVLFTAMDYPLGRTVGNGPEVEESLALLSGKGPEDLRDLSLILTAEMLRLAGLEPELESGMARARLALDEGHALDRFLSLTRAQGGMLAPDEENWGLPKPEFVEEIVADRDGFMPAPDARKVGMIAVHLGAGRTRAEDPVDPRAGLRFLKSWADPVARGDVLAQVEGTSPERVKTAATELAKLLVPATSTPEIGPLILARLDENGFRLEEHA
jgi:pyrimidine-nucleoside phosphorylase